MPTSLAALPPPNQAIPRVHDGDGGDGVPEYSFNELWQDKKAGLTFGDILDIVNPLQHIPIVSTIYRMITGDKMGIGANLAGAALYGGPFGVLAAGAIAIVEDVSGETIDQRVASLFNETPSDKQAPQIAGNSATGVGQTAAADGSAPATTMAASADAAPAGPAPVTVAAMQPAVAPRRAAVPFAASPAGGALPTARLAGGEKTKAAADETATRQRIAKAIEDAQRAQAGLLLASVEANRPATQQSDKDGKPSPATRPAAETVPMQPFRSHPYMLPPGAPPQMIGRAMERALDRYQALLQQKKAAATPAAPPAVPAPAR